MNSHSFFTLAVGVSCISCLPAKARESGADLESLMHRSNGIVSLWEAAEHGDEATLRKRLQEGNSPNALDDLGNTPLHLAVLQGNGSLTATLLEQGADATIEDAQGRRPSRLAKSGEIKNMCLRAEEKRLAELDLVQALEEKDEARALRLIKQGVNANALTKDHQESALMKAAETGMAEAAGLLLQKGANADYASPRKETVLHAAVSGGNPRVVRLLLQAGASPTAQKNNGATPLHDAIWSGKSDVVQVLLPALAQEGYNPDGGMNGRPIELAIQRGRSAMVRMILEAGLDVNSPVFKTPLLIQATQRDNADMVRALLEAGARRDATDEHGKSARDYASTAIAPLLK